MTTRILAALAAFGVLLAVVSTPATATYACPGDDYAGACIDNGAREQGGAE